MNVFKCLLFYRPNVEASKVQRSASKSSFTLPRIGQILPKSTKGDDKSDGNAHSKHSGGGTGSRLNMKEVLAVAALSFHSHIEGLVIGLGHNTVDVWQLFAGRWFILLDQMALINNPFRLFAFCSDFNTPLHHVIPARVRDGLFKSEPEVSRNLCRPVFARNLSGSGHRHWHLLDWFWRQLFGHLDSQRYISTVSSFGMLNF